MLVNLPLYTLIHVVLSGVGIFAGPVVVGGLMAGVRFGRWVGLFLTATVLTNLTGFGFPFLARAPNAKICLNTTPADTAEAVRRRI